MDSRRFEIRIVSAENLPDIRRWGRMKTYAAVSLGGSFDTTNVDREGETCPTWDFPFVYNVDESLLQRPGLDVVVDLYCEKTFTEDKLIGRVVIPVKSLFDNGLESQQSLGFPVAGTPRGRLYIRYCFEEKLWAPPKRSGWLGERNDHLRLTRASFDFKGSPYYDV